MDESDPRPFLHWLKEVQTARGRAVSLDERGSFLRLGQEIGTHRVLGHLRSTRTTHLYLAQTATSGLRLLKIARAPLIAPDRERLDRAAALLDAPLARHSLIDAERCALERCAHESVPRLKGHGVHDGCAYLIIPWYANKRSLDTCHTQLTRVQRLLVLSELWSAVLYMHAVGVVHRDITLRNVLVHRELAEVAETDMWVNPFRQRSSTLIDFELASIDGVGVPGLVGTRAYRPPEQWATAWTGTPRDGVHTDYYSFGVVAASVLTGAPPTRPERGALRLGGQPFDRLGGELADNLRMSLQGLLSREPRQRSAAAHQFKAALGQQARMWGISPKHLQIEGEPTPATAVPDVWGTDDGPGTPEALSIATARRIGDVVAVASASQAPGTGDSDDSLAHAARRAWALWLLDERPAASALIAQLLSTDEYRSSAINDINDIDDIDDDDVAKVLASGGGRPDEHVLALLSLGDWQRAYDGCRALVTQRPEDARQAVALLLRLLVALGSESRRGVSAIRPVELRTLTDDVDELARALLEDRSPAECSTLPDITSNSPAQSVPDASAPAWKEQLRAHLDAGRWRQALTEARAAAERTPEDAAPWLAIGEALLQGEQWQLASDAGLQAIARDAHDPTGWLLVLRARAALDLPGEAGFFQAALDHCLTDPQALARIADALASQGAVALAMDVVRVTHYLHGAAACPWELGSLLGAELGSFDAALACAHAAHHHDPDDPQARLRLVGLYLAGHHPLTALSLVRVDRESMSPELASLGLDAAERLGNLQLMGALAMRLLKDDPHHVRALELVLRESVLLMRHADALPIGQTLLGLSPSPPTELYYALALWHTGSREDADTLVALHRQRPGVEAALRTTAEALAVSETALTDSSELTALLALMHHAIEDARLVEAARLALAFIERSDPSERDATSARVGALFLRVSGALPETLLSLRGATGDPAAELERRRIEEFLERVGEPRA